MHYRASCSCAKHLIFFPNFAQAKPICGRLMLWKKNSKSYTCCVVDTKLVGFLLKNVQMQQTINQERTNKLTFLFARSYEPGTLHLSNLINAGHFFWFCLQVFRQAGPPQRVDCLGPIRNRCKRPFPRIQRRIASFRIEPGVSNLSITSLMLCNCVIATDTLQLFCCFHDTLFDAAASVNGFLCCITFFIIS